MELNNNPEYNRYQRIMQRAIDAYEGEDAVKAKRETYLPRLLGMNTGENSKKYEIYLQNATFFPATGRTIDAYSGMLFRKKPVMHETEQYDVNKITYDGQSINHVAYMCAKNIMLNTRCAVLVDYPSVDTDGMSQADVDRLNLKPYFVFYPQDKILDWQLSNSNGLQKLKSVTLFEDYDEEKHGELLKHQTGYARRVLTLANTEGRDIYVSQIWAKTSDDKEYSLITEESPMINGETFSYLPITPCSISGGWELDYPMINDLVLLNLADYRNEALYRDILYFLGRPTPCLAGLKVDETQETVTLGSSTILQFHEGGNWGLLAGDANAAGALRDESDRLKRQLANVGSRSLMSDSNVQEAAETANIRRAGESGVLSLIARAVNSCLTASYRIIGEWIGDNAEDYFYRLNTDYVSQKADVQTIQAAFGMYMQGKIPLSVFYNVLDKAEILPEDMTEDKFREESEAEKEPEVAGSIDIT